MMNFVKTTLAVLMLSGMTSTTPAVNHGRKSIKTADGGEITLLTTKKYKTRGRDILLSKTNADGNEEWFKFYGGRSYDLASDFAKTPDGGYIILGSTSSYGKGNYDIYLVKVDARGKEKWSKTFGGSYNEYGKSIEVNAQGGFRIVGTKQLCENTDDPTPDCLSNAWVIQTDAKGKKLSQSLIEN